MFLKLFIRELINQIYIITLVFENGINRPFSSTFYYFKSKIVEGSHKMRKQCFLNFWALLLKMYILEVVSFVSGLLLIQSTQSFSGSTYLQDSSF